MIGDPEIHTLLADRDRLGGIIEKLRAEIDRARAAEAELRAEIERLRAPSGPRVPDAPGWWWWRFAAEEWRPLLVYYGNRSWEPPRLVADVDGYMTRTIGIAENTLGEWGGRCVPPESP